VHTSGAQALAIIQGGYDSIINCTFANYGGIGLSHANNGTVAVLNYFNNGDGTWEPGELNGVMRNCIVYGSLDSEIVCDSLGGAGAAFTMDHCLLKMGSVRENFVKFNTCIFNEDPMFEDEQGEDFHIKAESPASGAGNPAYTLFDDLDGEPRGGSGIG